MRSNNVDPMPLTRNTLLLLIGLPLAACSAQKVPDLLDPSVQELSDVTLARRAQPPAGQRFLVEAMFNEKNELVRPETLVPERVAGVCTAGESAEAGKTLLTSPRVDFQSCDGTEDYVFGVDDTGHPTWKFPVPGDIAIESASQDVIVLRTLDGVFALSPFDGTHLTPNQPLRIPIRDYTDAQYDTLAFEPGTSTFYWTQYTLMRDRPARLRSWTVGADSVQDIFEMPSMEDTVRGLYATSSPNVPGRQAIALGLYSLSRYAYSGCSILSTARNEFLMRKELDDYSHCEVITGRDGHVGFMIRNAIEVRLMHYRVK